MRPSAPEKDTPACSRNEGSSSAVPPSPGGLPFVLAVGRLSGRSSPGGRRWAPSGRDSRASTRRRQLAEPMLSVHSARPPRGAAVQGFARTVPKLGTAQYERIRFKCVWRHRTRRQYGPRTGDIHLGRRRSALTRMFGT